MHDEYNLSDIPVDILSFDSFFIETDSVQGKIIRGKRSGIFQQFSTDVDPGYKKIAKFRGGIQWYKMETKDFISSISFKYKTENGSLASFNGRNLTFSSSIEEVLSFKQIFVH